MGRNCGQEAKRLGWTQDLLFTSYLLVPQLMFDTWSTVIHTEVSSGIEAGSITRASDAERWWDGGGLRQNLPFSSFLLQHWQMLPSKGEGPPRSTPPTWLGSSSRAPLHLPGSRQNIYHLQVLECKPQQPGPDGTRNCVPTLDLCFSRLLRPRQML